MSPNSLTLEFVRRCLILRFVLRLSAYQVSRVRRPFTMFHIYRLTFSIGIAKNYIQTTLEMKKNVSIIILDKLREFYSSFSSLFIC